MPSMWLVRTWLDFVLTFAREPRWRHERWEGVQLHPFGAWYARRLGFLSWLAPGVPTRVLFSEVPVPHDLRVVREERDGRAVCSVYRRRLWGCWYQRVIVFCDDMLALTGLASAPVGTMRYVVRAESSSLARE